MQSIRLDPYGGGKLAAKRADPPQNAAQVAEATVYYEWLCVRETYWLSPGSDGADRYRLWFAVDQIPTGLACCGEVTAPETRTATEAAATLLEALWDARFPLAAGLDGFESAGLVERFELERILERYNARLTPRAIEPGAPTTVGDLHYEAGELKYSGELRDGIPDGRGKGFWENGTTWCDGTFRAGKPHGWCRIYFQSGVLRHEGKMVEGLPSGRGTEYYENGQVWFDGTFDTQGPHYGYGARIWTEGRLFDRDGTLQHEGLFLSNGKHSYPAPEGTSDSDDSSSSEWRGEQSLPPKPDGSLYLVYAIHGCVEVGDTSDEPDVWTQDPTAACRSFDDACERLEAEVDDEVELIHKTPEYCFTSAEYWGVLLFRFPEAMQLKIEAGGVTEETLARGLLASGKSLEDFVVHMSGEMWEDRDRCRDAGPFVLERLSDHYSEVAEDLEDAEPELDGEEERCPYCGVTQVAGTAEECEHFVGVHHEAGLIWGSGDRISEAWSEVTCLVEQLLEDGIDGADILQALPAPLARLAKEAGDLLWESPVEVLPLFAECCNGPDIEIGGLDDIRISFYCSRPGAIDEALECMAEASRRLAALGPERP